MMVKMKILITGAAGMLAAEVIPLLVKDNHQVIQTDIHRRLPDIEVLDVTDKEVVIRRVKEVGPDHIFHFAAETNVDLCQEDRDHAFKVNSEGTENLARAAKVVSAVMVYISTGAVFDGIKDGPYTELDEPGNPPANYYGESKLEGERIVEKILSKYFIVRAGWMVGGWELDKKFVYKIVGQLKQGKKELIAVNDKFGTPSFTRDFAANLIPLVNTNQYGLYHMVNKGSCTRYDMAVQIVKSMGLADEVKVNAVKSDRFPLPAPRGISEALVNNKLDYLGLNNMPLWQDSLDKYIKENKDK